MKKTVLILGILILAFSLIACGNTAVVDEPENTEVSTTEPETNEVENETEEVSSETEEVTSEEELAVGKPIPNFELTTLEGSSISLHDYQGKILLLNFWASW